MKITILAGFTAAILDAAIGSSALQAQAPQPVLVCMSDGTAPGWVDVQARAQASRMFWEIGVAIQWQCVRPSERNISERYITIQFSDAVSSDFEPSAMAYALPFQDRIQVLYDRIARVAPGNAAPAILAHVLVHEITHVLERVCRHSETGVMKARWTSDDFHAMVRHPMPFAAIDVDLIRNGMRPSGAGLIAAK